MRPALGCIQDIEREIDSQRLLIATDFDGTLCPISPSRSLVAMPPGMVDVLNELLRLDRVSLAIISGRALSDLEPRVPVKAVLSGNHGLEIRGPGMRYEHEPARELRPQLLELLTMIQERVRGIPGASVEDKGLTATVHYRQVATASHTAIEIAVRRCVLGSLFAVRPAAMAVEIYPDCGWNKGSAVQWIRRRLGFGSQQCVCIGDDETDESMFTANTGGPNIRVGFAAGTAAQYGVSDPGELTAFFARLAHRLRCRADLLVCPGERSSPAPPIACPNGA